MMQLLSPLYVKIYVVLTLSYFWYRFILLFLTEIKSRKKPVAYNNETISVLVPFYNEKTDALDKTIISILKAKGNNEIIVVDDGSPDRAPFDIVSRKYSANGKIKILRYEKNAGKRKAQEFGFKYCTGEFIVTIDSDTEIDEDAIIKLINPMLLNKKVGATTGNVAVSNLEENFLTKMIASRYWNAFNIERKSLSGFGVVTCCSGVLSAYRREIMAECMEKYTSQKFLGEECTYGDDRHLTNLILMKKHRIEYVGESVCYTEVPNNMRQFFKQQLRWKKSFIRESIISLKFAFRHSFLLPIEVLYNLFIPFMGLAIRIAVLTTLIMYPVFILPFILSVATIAIIRNFFLLFENRKLALYSVPYAFVHEFGLFWLYFYALFTLKKTGWGTR